MAFGGSRQFVAGRIVKVAEPRERLGRRRHLSMGDERGPGMPEPVHTMQPMGWRLHY
jgi:hypothetical protein